MTNTKAFFLQPRIRVFNSLRFPAKRTLRLSVEQLEGREVPASGLGIAGDFSAFVLHDATAFSSEIQGRAAVGGNASFTNYALGDALTNSQGTRDDLIVGSNLTVTNGQVFNGNVVYGGTGTFTSFGDPNGTVRQGSVINFATAETDLRALSDQYAAMPPNGSVQNAYGTVTLTGTNTSRNVFQVTASQLWNATNLIIKVPAGSSAIINVSGANARMQYMGMSVQGTSRDHVLINFNQATLLKLAGVGVQASVLAPRASVDFSNGQIFGTLVAGSWTGYGQIVYQPAEIIPTTGTSRISGMVYRDENKDGQPQNWEWRFQGVAVALSGTDVNGNPVSRSAITDAGGIYWFIDLPAGTYSIQVTAPSGYLPGQGTTGTFGGVPGMNTVTSIAIPTSQTSGGYNFGELAMPTPPVANSGISGMVYRDENKDGQPQNWEWRFQGVAVALSGTDANGVPVTRTTTTDAGGIYRFIDLPAGTYSIQMTAPSGYLPGQGTTGVFGGLPGLNMVTSISIPTSLSSGGYNFGELAV
jgi:choice-of-anchor A domain-containing protein